jgi:hypothetical protein
MVSASHRIAGNISVVEFDSLLMDFAEREGATDPARRAVATSNMNIKWRA